MNQFPLHLQPRLDELREYASLHRKLKIEKLCRCFFDLINFLQTSDHSIEDFIVILGDNGVTPKIRPSTLSKAISRSRSKLNKSPVSNAEIENNGLEKAPDHAINENSAGIKPSRQGDEAVKLRSSSHSPPKPSFDVPPTDRLKQPSRSFQISNADRSNIRSKALAQALKSGDAWNAANGENDA